MRDWLILPHRMTFEQMLAEACRAAGITREDILGPSRRKRVSWPRQDLMLALFERGHSYCEIGRLFNRTHAPALHGVAEAALRRSQPAVKPQKKARHVPLPTRRIKRGKRSVAAPAPPDAFATAFGRAFPAGADYRRGAYGTDLPMRKAAHNFGDASIMERGV